MLLVWNLMRHIRLQKVLWVMAWLIQVLNTSCILMLQNIFMLHYSIGWNFSSIKLWEGQFYGCNTLQIFDSIMLFLEIPLSSICYRVWAIPWLLWFYLDRIWLLPSISYDPGSPLLLFQRCTKTSLHMIGFLQ